MQLVRRARPQGFTLIELLVVIAIIAILASILFPIFSSAKSTAQRSACMNNMKELATAFALYKGDWGGWYPLGGSRATTADRSLEWQNSTWKYTKKNEVYRCPSTTLPNMDYSEPGDEGSDISKPRTPVTYLYNSYIGQDDAYIEQHSHTEGQIRVATKCIMLMEGHNVVGSANAGTDCHGQQGTLWLRTLVFRKSARDVTGRYGMPWHGGGNIASCDGHISFCLYKDAATLEARLPWRDYVCLQGVGLGFSDSDKWGP